MRVFDLLTYPFRRHPRKPLAARRPDRADMVHTRSVPLGMEATDLALVDKVSRRNDALERTTQIGSGDRHAYAARSSLHVKAMPEDETYATRFHRMFQMKGSAK